MNNNQNLVQLSSSNNDIMTCIAYASDDNFTGKPVYDKPLCFLHKEAAQRLSRAVELLKPMGLRIKIWDGYRPVEAQWRLFQHTPDPLYVSHPETGIRPHCRGIAIDLTLIDQEDRELPMGTAFDDFRPLAHHGNQDIGLEEQKNRLLLAGVMALAGFEHLGSEWWHYQLSDAHSYPIIDESKARTGIISL